MSTESSLIELIAEGDPSPDVDGLLSHVSSGSGYNSNGYVTGFAIREGNSGGTQEEQLLYLKSADGGSVVAHTGQDLGGLVMTYASGGLLNENNHIVFFPLTVNQTGAERDTYMYYDGHDFYQIARGGSPLLGSRILQFGGWSDNGETRSSFNDSNQLVFQVSLLDGREALMLFTLPEPSNIVLLSVGVVVILCRRASSSDLQS